MAQQKTAAFSLNFGKLPLLMAILDRPLHGEQARARNVVYKALKPFDTEREAKRMALIEELATKDAATGKAILDPKTNNYVFEDGKKESFISQYQAYLTDNNAVVDITDTKQPFRVVRDIIKNWETPLSIDETDLFDDLCKAFEKI
jgi:hypothetical protein